MLVVKVFLTMVANKEYKTRTRAKLRPAEAEREEEAVTKEEETVLRKVSDGVIIKTLLLIYKKQDNTKKHE